MRAERLLAVLLLLIMLCPTAVSATNTQGLAWGLSIGDKFDYAVTSTTEYTLGAYTTQIAFESYIVVTSLPDLPNVITTPFPDLQGPNNYNQTYSKETQLTFPWVAVPIGNWTLLTELLQQIPINANATIIDTSTEWGFVRTTHYSSSNTTETIRISKSDGAMNYYKREAMASNPSSYSIMEGSRKGGRDSLNTLQLIPIIITLASLGVIVVVGVLVIRRRP